MPDAPPRTHHLAALPREEYIRQMGEAYALGQTPWDTGVPSAELLRVVEEGGLRGKTLLELGCGSGTNAIELARRGYRVTAVDLIDLPIHQAREKARRAGVEVDFRVGDLTRLPLGGPYDCVLDVGVYHGIRRRDLDGFLATLKRATRQGSRWLSLAGNGREPFPTGPPVVLEEEFRAELGGMFSFLQVREFRFDLGPEFRALAWSILMERK